MYAVAAEVVDIRSDNPLVTDSFLVDTCVWYVTTYTKVSLGLSPSYQVRYYPKYLRRAKNAGARLFRCSLSFAELAHNIERAERDLFNAETGRAVQAKDYRHNFPSERANVISEVDTAWGQTMLLADPIEANVDERTVDAALSRMGEQPLDGYDSCMLELIQNAGIAQILTDDRDYACVPGIRVFTANRNVISAAQQAGRLITR